MRISNPNAEYQPSDRIGRWRGRITAENPSLQPIYLPLIPTRLDFPPPHPSSSALSSPASRRRRRRRHGTSRSSPLHPPARPARLLLTVSSVLAGPEEGQGPAAVVQAGQVRRREAEEEEVEQGEAEGEGQQRGALRPGHLRQAALRGSQVQADHPVRPLRAPQGNITSPLYRWICDLSISSYLVCFTCPTDDTYIPRCGSYGIWFRLNGCLIPQMVVCIIFFRRSPGGRESPPE